jgi:hypothetical protein
MSEYKEPADCPKCGKSSDRILSPTKFKTSGGGHKNTWDGKGVMK